MGPDPTVAASMRPALLDGRGGSRDRRHAARASSSSECTAPATALGVGEAAEAAAESYGAIELSENVCLDSVGEQLADALRLDGVPFDCVRKQEKDGRHLNNFWYKARWGPNSLARFRMPTALGGIDGL